MKTKQNKSGYSILSGILCCLTLLLAPVQTRAQARITSPPTSQALPNPFTLVWNNPGAAELFLYLSANNAGGNELLARSFGTGTSASFSWNGQGNPPATLYVRLWSRFGNQWRWSDYAYRTSTVTAPPPKTSLQLVVDGSISQYQADNGKIKLFGGQCKAYLQGTFAAVANRLGIKTSSGLLPVMPQSLSGYYWDEYWKSLDGKSESAFRKVAQVQPRNMKVQNSMSAQKDAIRTLLLQAKRGDMIQYGTLRSTGQALHTLAITEDVQNGVDVKWADSNWTPNTVVSNHTKKFDAMIDTLSTDKVLAFPEDKPIKTWWETHPQGATLYRATNLR